MSKKDDAARFVDDLKAYYPEAVCALEYGDSPYRLLIMARLSAQCTDARVNIVSESLFKKFPTLESFAEAEPAVLAAEIYSCGLHNSKARDIAAMCRTLILEHGGIVPSGMDDLLNLPGVGRKIANLIRGDVFGLPAIVADTHCIRVANRLGLADSKDPAKVEKQLMALIEPAEQNDFCHRLIHLGREFCKSQNPRCEVCFLNEKCAARNLK
ncbi:endonuclease III [Clostridia bacterium]|nr:endonuclease III [Clostridia bacterium]